MAEYDNYGEEKGLTRDLKEAARTNVPSRADADGSWRRRGTGAAAGGSAHNTARPGLGSGGALSLDPRRQPNGPPTRTEPALSRNRVPARGPARPVQPPVAPQRRPVTKAAAPVAPSQPEKPVEDKGAPPSRTIDVYWQSYPQETVWIRKSRRETVREVKSRMPVVLRNLAPDTAFNPQSMWEAEKQRMKDAAARLASSEEEASAGAGAGAAQKNKQKKPKKPSKKEELIEKNKRDQEEKDVKSDLEKLENAAKSCRSKSELGNTIFSAKCATPVGRLRQLLMVLEAEVKEGNEAVVLDVLWAIESNSLYCAALEQEDDITETKDEESSSTTNKKKKQHKDAKSPNASPSRSPEALIVKEFKKELRAAKKIRKEMGTKLAAFQLEQMYDRLPPLSPFLKGWKLDAWQKKVLHYVDARKSAIVCAPTSSGKTVISTYTCVNYKRVLFVVPTEPLVWQVAAMFERLLAGAGQVALATNQLAYRPSEDKSRVVVGTPLALESALVKIRGVVGGEATAKRWDFAQLDGGFDDFEYAVFDEVHALDGDEGAALQRLIRYVSCPTLALSATIGNAEELQQWWQSVRDDATEKAGVDTVELVEHKGRFINVQNLILSPKRVLERLHPCAALSAQRLINEDVSLALTPTDASTLYNALAAEYGDKVADLDPSIWFRDLAKREEAMRINELKARAARGNPAFVTAYERATKKTDTSSAKAAASARGRITLDGAKRYGDALKLRLTELANEDSKRLDEKLLGGFTPEHLLTSTTKFSMLDAALQMRQKVLFPALAFHLDSFKCLELFKTLIADLEAAERTKFPNWSQELRAKAEANEKQLEAQEKLKEKNTKMYEEDARDGFDDGGADFIDVSAPHPEFVLAPPTARLSAKEIDDILFEIKKDTNASEKLEASHVLVRALRRGLAIYIDDAAFAVYRRIVQRLAQQGKLAIVFSDVSLAYGVNMPFRTVAFCGDEGLLTPLLAQQMAGRAGRRGLDTQGNLIYLGMDWERIRGLMVGTVPAIVGKAPHFSTMSLPLMLHRDIAIDDALCDFVDRKIVRRLCASSLEEFSHGTKRPADECEDLVKEQLDTVKKLGFQLRSTSSGAPGSDSAMHNDVRPSLCMAWELRDYLAESVVIAHALPELMTDFVKDRFNFKRALDDAGSEAIQIEFMAVLLHIIDRKPAPPGTIPLDEISWLAKSPERKARWDKWEKFLVASQERLDSLPAHHAEALKLSVPPGNPIDAAVFEVCKDRRLPPAGAITSLERHLLKTRIWHVGNILMKCHNCLQLPGEYIPLSPLLRKCCQRIKYILTDDIKADVDERDIQQFIAARAAGADEEEEEEPPSPLKPGEATPDDAASPSK